MLQICVSIANMIVTSTQPLVQQLVHGPLSTFENTHHIGR